MEDAGARKPAKAPIDSGDRLGLTDDRDVIYRIAHLGQSVTNRVITPFVDNCLISGPTRRRLIGIRRKRTTCLPFVGLDLFREVERRARFDPLFAFAATRKRTFARASNPRSPVLLMKSSVK